jgi:cell wall-associated NlpC family hydrolase
MNGIASICVVFILMLAGCDIMQKKKGPEMQSLEAKDSLLGKDSRQDSIAVDTALVDNTKTQQVPLPPSKIIDTKNVHPNDVVSFAKTLIGTPYVYGSTNPKVGFDCSGFITYVFNHFGIGVPRSSIDFTDVGKEVNVEAAKSGDLILFTGTNPQERFVGHMGIVVSNTDTLEFVHSTSGKAMSVTITPLSKYYMTRFVKVIRIFPQNDQ